MLHVNKPLPPAITHNDELAQAILLELRGLRDDLEADRAERRAAASTISKAAAESVGKHMVANLKRAGVQVEPIELREPAPGPIDLLPVSGPMLPEPAAPVAPAPQGRKKKTGT